MFKSVTGKSITAIVSAGLVASLTVFLTSGVPETKAEGDHLPELVKGATCSSHGWPYYEPICQFDLRVPGNAARAVRVIPLR
jgi:hypothetical protein